MNFIELFNALQLVGDIKKVFSPTKDCQQFQLFYMNGAKLDCNESSVTMYPKKGSTEKAKKLKIEDVTIEQIINFCEL
jgi:hypothetical protein